MGSFLRVKPLVYSRIEALARSAAIAARDQQPGSGAFRLHFDFVLTSTAALSR